jgi:predicted MarR family transcription regulator
MSALEQKSHLAQTEEERKVFDLELQLWRTFYGFLRWQQECERNTNGTNLTGPDLSVLHVIRMRDRPKSIAEIARLLNRDDDFNIQYSIRKLLKMKLIQKVRVHNSRSVAYQVTQDGTKNTTNFANTKKKILVEKFIKDPELQIEQTTYAMTKLKSIYEEAEHSAAYQATAYPKNEIE